MTESNKIKQFDNNQKIRLTIVAFISSIHRFVGIECYNNTHTHTEAESVDCDSMSQVRDTQMKLQKSSEIERAILQTDFQ